VEKGKHTGERPIVDSPAVESVARPWTTRGLRSPPSGKEGGSKSNLGYDGGRRDSRGKPRMRIQAANSIAIYFDVRSEKRSAEIERIFSPSPVEEGKVKRKGETSSIRQLNEGCLRTIRPGHEKKKPINTIERERRSEKRGKEGGMVRTAKWSWRVGSAKSLTTGNMGG